MNDIEIKHDSESFYETLNRLIQEHIEDNDYGWLDYIFEDEEATRIYHSILEAFEIYGSFLDCIPFADREIIINGNIPDQKGVGDNCLIREILRYSKLPLDKEMKEIYPAKDSQRRVQKTMKIITEFENLIDSIVWNSMEGRYPVERYGHLLLALETTEYLKEDLLSKNFKIFSLTDYYAWNLPTKIPLKNILTDLVKNYGIKGATTDKKDLMDFF